MCEIVKFYNPYSDSIEINQLITAYEIKFSLERMLKNIDLINTGINAKSITVSNTSLYRIAANEYQDATLWTYLADVNKIDDPVITSAITIKIPPKPSNNFRFGE